MSVKLGHELWRQGFPGSSVGKESACNARDVGSIPGLGRSSGEGKGYPLQYSGLENSMDFIVHGVAKSRRQLNDFHFHFHLWRQNASHSCSQTTVCGVLRVIGMIPNIPLRSLQSQNLVYYLFSLLTFVFMVQKQW